MTKLLTACVVALVAFHSASAAQAGEEPLTGTQIKEILSGNTVFGEQKGTPWKQYFDADGATVYISGDDAPSPGRWTVRGDHFCSQWPPSENWDCYKMTGADQNVTWIFEGGGDPWPAKVVPGRQID